MKCLADRKTVLKVTQDEVMEFTVDAMKTAFAITMLDKSTLSVEEVDRLIEETVDLFDSAAKGYVTVRDLKQTLIDDYNYNVNRRKG